MTTWLTRYPTQWRRGGRVGRSVRFCVRMSMSAYSGVFFRREWVTSGTFIRDILVTRCPAERCALPVARVRGRSRSRPGAPFPARALTGTRWSTSVIRSSPTSWSSQSNAPRRGFLARVEYSPGRGPSPWVERLDQDLLIPDHSRLTGRCKNLLSEASKRQDRA